MQLLTEQKQIDAERKALAQATASRQRELEKQAEEERKAEEARLKQVSDTQNKIEDLKAKAIDDDETRAKREAEISYNRAMNEIDNQILASREDAELNRALCELKEETQRAYYASLEAIDSEYRQKEKEQAELAAAETLEQQNLIREQQISNHEAKIALMEDEDARELAQQQIKLERLDFTYEQEREKYRENQEMLALIDEEYSLKRQEIEKTTADLARSQHKEKMSQIQQQIKSGIEQSASAAQGLDKESKATRALMKVKQGLMVAEAAKGLATGIAEAASAGWPAMLASIPAVFGMMLALVTQIKTMSNTAGYATGGYVSGAGTSTSDSIHARLSNGEYVVNARSTAANLPLLEAINNSGNQGVALQSAGNATLAQELALAVSAQPAPVVSVEDITRGNDRVSYIRQIGVND